MTITDDREWTIDAACRDSDPERWFAFDGKGAEGVGWNGPAIRICHGCPVRLRCTQEGEKKGEIHAVMGGFRLWRKDDREKRDEWLELQGCSR